jgi:EmrB/QacA subfamily drug resistance transporter
MRRTYAVVGVEWRKKHRRAIGYREFADRRRHHRSVAGEGAVAATSTGTATGIGLRSERGPILLSVMLCTALVAIDATIIATAIPSIVSDLGGFSQFPWLFSIYLLAQSVTIPLYGKFADSLGRKPVMLFGITVFLIGSIMCGAAWSMPVLIVARVVQGFGAGAIMPMSMTIIGDLYSVEERSRVQGYVASVWGMASVVGPTLGGVFSEYASWRWIFFINLPIGALAVSMLVRRFHEAVDKRTHQVDYAGATLLTAGCSLLILALLEGGRSWAWGSAISVVIVAVGSSSLAGFVLVERAAVEPVLPLWVFSRRILVGGNLTAITVGAILIGLTSYVPTYAQGVLGHGALAAGFALASMTVGWPISAAIAGRIYLRIGFRNTSFLGAAFVITGSLLTLTLGTQSNLVDVGGYCFVIGFGLGWLSAPTLVAVQSVVGWNRRGVVTATNVFGRSIGSAVGVAVFGAIANATLANAFDHPPAGLSGRLPRTADDASLVLDKHADAGPAVSQFVRSALDDATHHVFLALVVVAVLTVGALALMPRRAEPLDFE